MFYGGLDTAVVDTTDDERWMRELHGEAIELNDLTAWRAEQNANTKIAETPIKDVDPLTEFLEKCNNRTMYDLNDTYNDDEDEDDDDSDDYDDEDTVEDNTEHSWDPVYINADGSVDVTLSDAETDDIEDFISLLSESSENYTDMTNLSKLSARNLENSKCTTSSSVGGKSGRQSVQSPSTRKQWPKLSTPHENYSPKNLMSPQENYSPKSLMSPQENNLSKKCKIEETPLSGTNHVALSVLKMNKIRHRNQVQTKEQIEEENRLRGGATIMAKLPINKNSDASKSTKSIKLSQSEQQNELIPNQKMVEMRKLSPSVAESTKTQVLSTSVCRLSNVSSEESNYCGYHIRVKRNQDSDNSQSKESEIVSLGPRCRFICDQDSTASSYFTTRNSKRHSLSDDSTFQLEDLSSGTLASFNAIGSDSSERSSSRKLRRSLSTNRITDELRAKLGLQSKTDTDSSIGKTSFPPTIYASNYFFNKPTEPTVITCRQAATQTLPLCRYYSDTLLTSRENRICSRCCQKFRCDEGIFTCDSCVGVQRVKNSLILELFADKPSSNAHSSPRIQNTSCYGVRVGVGLLPIVVLIMSVVICSVIFFSDSVMSNVCHRYCDEEFDDKKTSPRSAWAWLDPYNA